MKISIKLQQKMEQEKFDLIAKIMENNKFSKVEQAALIGLVENHWQTLKFVDNP